MQQLGCFKSLLLSHHHSSCALVSEILESVLQTVLKQFTHGQYIFTEFYRWQCAIYTYIYSVHTVYYYTYLQLSRHIIHHMYIFYIMYTYIHTIICLIALGKKLSPSRLVWLRMLRRHLPGGSRESSLWDGWLESLMILWASLIHHLV